MSSEKVLTTIELGAPPWPTLDPFLFCVHHLDRYPAANEKMGPAASLEGRNLGMDFEGKDGWRMYHGREVPGFPRHPHRGFETITIARQGFIDHSDSLGAAARFGHGDVQWMTAGRGVVHAESFPLLDRQNPNTTELFQIWLNLPRKDKLVDPYFTMFWNEDVPEQHLTDDEGRATRLRVVAGPHGDLRPPEPPPNSWAARPEAGVEVWTITMEPGARWTLPATSSPSDEHHRVLYFFSGDTLRVADEQEVKAGTGVQVRPDAEIVLVNGAEPAEILLLGGRPIGEPVAQHGPFVMNAPGEIRQAMIDYQRTQFGGWPWEAEAPVHPRDRGRFARHADGTIEER